MLRNKTLRCLLILFLCGFNAISQDVIFTEAPEEYQLYARSENDSAVVRFAGKLTKETDITELLLKVYKDKKPYDTQKVVITDKGFDLTTKIDAGLHQFKFELYVEKNKKESLYQVIDSVVCGDAYIISGQSNSHASSSLSTYSDSHARSFGVKTGYETYDEDDKKIRWGKATGNAPNLEGIGAWFKKNQYGVGVWGMELMRLLVEEHQVPICIINGGSGSSSIEQNMLYPEIPSLDTSFGRLAYRVNQAGLKDKIKAILWHQGESNTSDKESYEAYANNFDQLLTDWKRIYTGLEKIYLFQLHPGCGGDYQSELREVQQRIANADTMIEIMSTAGVIGHDGCHFSHAGYLEFAQRIFPLLSRDFYKKSYAQPVTPPKLKNVYYEDDKRIVIDFDQPVKIEKDQKIGKGVWQLNDQFFFETSNHDLVSNVVKKMNINDTQIILELKAAKSYKSITYLPGHYYTDTKESYNGPWITGTANKIGALSFDKRRIEKEKNAAQWHGYHLLNDTLNGINYKVVFPKSPNPEKKWIWRARFWGHEPQTDIALLEKGFHLAYIDVSSLFGNERAITIWDDFYNQMTTQYELNKKVVLEGMSRGGLIVFNWANRNAEKVASIYVDAPVADFKSWPGGKGVGKGSDDNWKSCLEQYDFTEQQAFQYNGNPIDHLENLAAQKVPILSIVGDADDVVPVSENTEKIKKRLQSLGWDMQVIAKPGIGHHPHSLENPKPIIDFILENSIYE